MDKSSAQLVGATQALARHSCPAMHGELQAPQCCSDVRVSMHDPPQFIVGAAHTPVSTTTSGSESGRASNTSGVDTSGAEFSAVTSSDDTSETSLASVMAIASASTTSITSRGTTMSGRASAS